MGEVLSRELGLPELESVAVHVLRCANAGDVIALRGDLGTGKTTFVRAALRGMGWTEDVPSPTFTLAQMYDIGDRRIWHFDLYRLSVPQEAIEIGIDEAFSDGISFIEWPERLAGLLPANHLEIELMFVPDEDRRRVVIRGGEDWTNRLADLPHPA